MKRVIKNTRDLDIGMVFYRDTDTEYIWALKIISQGPEWVGIEGACDNCHWLSHHYDVWVDVPRTTVGEFNVGERFARHDEVWTVTAVGETSSIAKKKDGFEGYFRHDDRACEESE